MMNYSTDLFYQRRSIRKFTDQPVEKEKLEEILRAAMAAPSAMNMQSWEIVVIDDEQVLNQIRKALVYGKMNAPLAMSVCGNLSVFKKQLTKRFWVQDCSAVTQNILLAATALGLGSVWCGVHPITTFERRISQILGLPENIIPLNVIYLGYPAEQKEPRTQFKQEKVHHNTY